LAKALEQVDEKLKAIYAAPQEKTS
jgi:hypothetical protein